MNKKCLIINGSPKAHGNTSFLIDEFKKHYKHNIDVVDAFPMGKKPGISSCIDCGGCTRVKGCVIKDSFQKIVSDDHDLVLIVSPIYMSNLPGPMINVVNRFNFMFNNRNSLNLNTSFKEKNAALILVGGGGACKMLQGETNEDLAIKQSKYIFGKINAKLEDEDIILCLNTDEVKVDNNSLVIDAIKKLAIKFN